MCGVVLQPIAGYRADSMLVKYVAGRRDLELWFAPIVGTSFIAPIRVLMPTLIGTLEIAADQFDAVAVAAGASPRYRNRCRRRNCVTKANRISSRPSGRSTEGTIDMRVLIAVLAIALLTVTAHAQGMGRGPHQQKPVQKTEDLAKKKALEQDYKNALKNIPEVKEKPDPWKTMR